MQKIRFVCFELYVNAILSNAFFTQKIVYNGQQRLFLKRYKILIYDNTMGFVATYKKVVLVFSLIQSLLLESIVKLALIFEFLKDFIYLLLQRGGGWEEERERNRSAPPGTHPNQEPIPVRFEFLIT